MYIHFLWSKEYKLHVQYLENEEKNMTNNFNKNAVLLHVFLN